jgi:hypothetical protein
MPGTGLSILPVFNGLPGFVMRLIQFEVFPGCKKLWERLSSRDRQVIK